MLYGFYLNLKNLGEKRAMTPLKKKKTNLKNWKWVSRVTLSSVVVLSYMWLLAHETWLVQVDFAVWNSHYTSNPYMTKKM